MRLLIIQYAGDYREAVLRFAEGGEETYYAQKYSVDAVAKIGKQIEEVATLCCKTTEPYNEILPNGVRGIGTGFTQKKIPMKSLIQVVEKYSPTHLIIRTPILELLRWAIQKQVPTLVVIADSFSTQGLRNKLKNNFISRILNQQYIEWIGNHGINSSLSLQNIGVNPNKIIPWDWPSLVTPDSFLPKTLRSDAKTGNLLYVGSVTEAKGVGDVLEAIAKLKANNLSVSLKIAGKGDIQSWSNRVKQLQIEDCVKFLGLIPNNTVVHQMREADIVLVPSRHGYPEGFPLTIYETFCSRTPLIASDHPIFKNKLHHGVNAMIFPAMNSTALAAAIEKLLSDPELYHSLSVASFEAWKHLQIPVKWSELVNRWLDHTPENQQWLFEHRLASGHYDISLPQ